MQHLTSFQEEREQCKEKQKCSYPFQRWTRSNEFQDEGMGILLDFGGKFAIHHNLVQFVPLRTDIIHENFIRCQGILNWCSVGIQLNLLQFHHFSQLTNNLHPETSLWVGIKIVKVKNNTITCDVSPLNSLSIPEKVNERKERKTNGLGSCVTIWSDASCRCVKTKLHAGVPTSKTEADRAGVTSMTRHNLEEITPEVHHIHFARSNYWLDDTVSCSQNRK